MYAGALIGIYLGRKVDLSAIANPLPGSARLHSTVQRLKRMPVGHRTFLCPTLPQRLAPAQWRDHPELL